MVLPDFSLSFIQKRAYTVVDISISFILERTTSLSSTGSNSPSPRTRPIGARDETVGVGLKRTLNSTELRLIRSAIVWVSLTVQFQHYFIWILTLTAPIWMNIQRTQLRQPDSRPFTLAGTYTYRDLISIGDSVERYGDSLVKGSSSSVGTVHMLVQSQVLLDVLQ